ncbi:CPBP family intramembrane glutamic endopeptidase [Halorubrum sp. Ea8]|uniref:CPBP family intramembrane glutamic endopeptidase n=1 Tax=Halorubrum sp. Ea8 TaxID=1383841 RepID=UPI001595472B|nr:CPBP family intramembrane glutamic endopeptidase [Halorubrum sp. Ea8]
MSTFLALAFGISWTSAAVLYLAAVDLGTLGGIALVTLTFMWAPAIAAIVVQWRSGESIRTGCGLRLGRLRWVGVAWVTPIALIAGMVGIGVLLPDVSFTTDYGAYLLDLGLTQQQADAAVAQLTATPLPPVLLLVLQGLIAGLTINALAALGEELGWRGLLLDELSPLGFWKVSGITGVIWGVWHAPIILQGHNFPDAPVAGVFIMTGAMVAMTPVYTYLTVRAESVLAATFFHGAFNGLGALSLVYLTGAGNLLIGPVGVVGIAAAFLLTLVCVVHDRFVAANEITTGEPLSPWG